MIRSMNKYAFLVFHSDYEGFLHKLRSLGVLHVNEQKDSREVEELRGILSERTHIKDTLRALRPYITDGAAELSQPIKNEAEGEALISEIEGELKRLSVQDEESLSKASQKIMRTNIELRKQKEEEEEEAAQ